MNPDGQSGPGRADGEPPPLAARSVGASQIAGPTPLTACRAHHAGRQGGLRGRLLGAHRRGMCPALTTLAVDPLQAPPDEPADAPVVPTTVGGSIVHRGDGQRVSTPTERPRGLGGTVSVV